MLEKEMSASIRLLYRFCSRGIIWPAVYGSVFGVCVFHFSTFVSAFLGGLIGYLFILPLIGLFTPITYSILLVAAAIVGLHSADPFWGIAAMVLLGIHLLRTILMFVLVSKYPAQTQALDAQYQKR